MSTKWNPIFTKLSTFFAANTFDVEDLNMDNCGYGRVQAYANSKLANVLFTKELHRRFHGKQVYIDPSHFFQTLNMKIDVNNVFCSINFFFVKSFLHFFYRFRCYCICHPSWSSFNWIVQSFGRVVSKLVEQYFWHFFQNLFLENFVERSSNFYSLCHFRRHGRSIWTLFRVSF